jgi:succinate-semialdehyde dehydrogenase/glutarate-semialdehyde dehydrogenase
MVHRRSYLHYSPRGVVGVIGPWNYPFLLNAVPAFMAWIAGNAVVVKPSEITPLIAMLFKEIWDDSGLPPELLQVAYGHGEVGAAVVDRVDHVVFTGSVATGRKVAEACARRLIPCTLELGGKHPALVYPDADLERVAAGITWGAFTNSGQVCASVERLYVHDSIHDELVGRLVEEATALRHGDPAQDESDVGAIIFGRQLDVVETLVADALDRGATLACGSATRREGPGQFHPPTILTGVTHEMRVAHEEIFGPLLPIVRWTDEEEVVRLANDSHLGLHASVWTGDLARGRRVAEQIRSGTTMVNDLISSNGMPEVPWHGVKNSGLGMVHADDGLRELCEMRHVNHPGRIPWLRRELWWFPYRPRTWTLLRRAAGLLFGRPASGVPRSPRPLDRERALPRGTVTPSGR